MALRNYMRDLMREQNASGVTIVQDASMAALPEDSLIGSCSSHTSRTCLSQTSLHEDSSAPLDDSTRSMLIYDRSTLLTDDSTEFRANASPPATPTTLDGFRKRHRMIKETLSPVKIYKISPVKGERDNQRSRLARLANESDLIDGPPGFNVAL